MYMEQSCHTLMKCLFNYLLLSISSVKFQDEFDENSPRHLGVLKPSGSHACEECFKTFSSPGKLKQHEYTHTGETPFECKIPGLSFMNLCLTFIQTLQVVIRSLHPNSS